MDCSQDLIHSYVDDELDPTRRAAVAEHIASCQECSGLCYNLMALRETVRESAPYFQAPETLRRSVSTRLGRAPVREMPRRREMPWRGIAIAASILLMASAVWNVAGLRQRARLSDVMAESIVSDHIRSLMGDHLLDVPSSDRHTVKPWFNGKLDFSPEVKDFAAEGFPLAGGRLDYIGGRPVAALIYQRRLHVITLFTCPNENAPATGSDFSRNGYHMLHWTSGQMSYWAISDISAPELQNFEALFNK